MLVRVCVARGSPWQPPVSLCVFVCPLSGRCGRGDWVCRAVVGPQRAGVKWTPPLLLLLLLLLQLVFLKTTSDCLFTDWRSSQDGSHRLSVEGEKRKEEEVVAEAAAPGRSPQPGMVWADTRSQSGSDRGLVLSPEPPRLQAAYRALQDGEVRRQMHAAGDLFTTAGKCVDFVTHLRLFWHR